MNRLFRFGLFYRLLDLSSSWSFLSQDGEISEGLRMEGDRVKVDFDQDQPGDVVKLLSPDELPSTKKEGIPVFKGYRLERVDDLKLFMEEVKKWGALDKESLSTLIDLTYPTELRDRQVSVIFITGSSDPLSANIAQALKDLYYPECKIVDVLKRYYGADVQDIVDWSEYEKADPKTREMIDVYLRGFSKSAIGKRAKDFGGYIKKSSGLQSGARRLLKPGHTIDSYIESVIAAKEKEWKERYMNDPLIPSAVKVRALPIYLVVDDTIIEGSTLRGIFKEFLDFFSLKELNTSLKRRLLGYCLFSYKG